MYGEGLTFLVHSLYKIITQSEPTNSNKRVENILTILEHLSKLLGPLEIDLFE